MNKQLTERQQYLVDNKKAIKTVAWRSIDSVIRAMYEDMTDKEHIDYIINAQIGDFNKEFEDNWDDAVKQADLPPVEEWIKFKTTIERYKREEQ